jgi:tRNA nucleotidyltransferase (CCA-adding enzyme)
MLSCLCDKPLQDFDEEEYYKYRALYLKMLKYLHIISHKIDEVNYDEKFRRIAKYSDGFLLNLAITFDSPQIERTLTWLRYSNNVIAGVKEICTLGHYLVDEADEWLFDDLKYPARKLLAKIENSDYHDIINFAKSLCDDVSSYRQRGIFLCLNALQCDVAQCIENCDVYSLKYLAINGNDLIEFGYKGKQIGEILNKLLDLVMRDRAKNIRAELLQIVKDGKLNAGI